VRALGEKYRLSSRIVHNFCIAFDEILSNIVKYGYKDQARHEISVRLELSGDHLVAEIVDDGEPFDPLSAPAPRLHGGVDERPVGGLGIYFVRTLMDDVEYERRNDRNVLVLSKRVPVAGGAQ
jgi:anti-sigma regulatory factor (Ser/Thr protein kinase)